VLGARGIRNLPAGAWVPDWYPLIQAAKYLGVAPWDLFEQGVHWQNWALIALEAEEDARHQLNDRR
jgi:hypothetical protein